MTLITRSPRVLIRALALVVGTVAIASVLTAPPADAASHAAREKAWNRSFAQLQKSLSGPAVVTVSGVRHGDQATTAGTLGPDVAWSTIKIPLAMAALRRAKGPITKDRVNRALRYSDNGAAAQLWAQLGGARKAPQRVDAVLRDYGDKGTRVRGKAVRRGYSAYGQTVWTTKRQDVLMRGIACNREGAYIRTQLDQAQSGYWGLRYFDRDLTKNGYGPVLRGFLVRQVALVTGNDGKRWSVAIAVRATSQSRGFADATRITQWIRHRITEVPAGRC